MLILIHHDASERFGRDQNNCSTSSRAATCPALGGAFDCAAGVVALHKTKHPRNPDPRRPRRQRRPPAGFVSAAEVADRGNAPLSTVYHWMKNGRLGTAHRWRNLLVVEEAAAEDFLAVRPL